MTKLAQSKETNCIVLAMHVSDIANISTITSKIRTSNQNVVSSICRIRFIWINTS